MNDDHCPNGLVYTVLDFLVVSNLTFESQKRWNEDEDLGNLLEDDSVADFVKENSCGDHSKTRDQEGKDNLAEKGPKRLWR